MKWYLSIIIYDFTQLSIWITSTPAPSKKKNYKKYKKSFDLSGCWGTSPLYYKVRISKYDSADSMLTAYLQLNTTHLSTLGNRDKKHTWLCLFLSFQDGYDWLVGGLFSPAFPLLSWLVLVLLLSVPMSEWMIHAHQSITLIAADTW